MKLTHFRRYTLKKLREKTDSNPPRSYGFLTKTIGDREAALCRRLLEPAGLVRIDRLADNSFRYAITDAGRAAIAEEASS